MNNVSMLIGRLVSDPQINKNENGRKVVNITLAVPRSFKNVDGIYETDFIPCILWAGIAETTVEYCRKGDLIAVRGRLQSTDNKIEIIAEKITFLANKPLKEEE